MTISPPGRDERILRALLIERRKPAEIARAEQITRARIGQILNERFEIYIRPVMKFGNVDKITAVLPDWKPDENG